MMKCSLWTIFAALVSAPRAGRLDVEDLLVKRALRPIRSTVKGRVAFQMPLYVAAGVAIDFVADLAQALDDVERDRLVLEVFDFVLHDTSML